jgi:hypothetical protein
MWRRHVVYESQPLIIIVTLGGHLYRIPEVVPTIVPPKQCHKVISQFMQDNDDMLSMETKEFKKGYQNAIMQLQKQYNLRSKKVHANPLKGNPTRELQINTPSSSQPNKDISTKDTMEKGKSKE